MYKFPQHIDAMEEGQREGFQSEKATIPTARRHGGELASSRKRLEVRS